jgi:arylsulfatase A
MVQAGAIATWTFDTQADPNDVTAVGIAPDSVGANLSAGGIVAGSDINWWGVRDATGQLDDPPPQQPVPERPNILFIMLDDVGAEAFSSYYGNPVNAADGQPIETPNIDTLASTGMRFQHAWGTPLCTPTRNVLMTGRYNFRVYRAFWHLDNAATTFAEVLREHGYTTGIASKWQLSDPGDHPARHDSGYGEDKGVEGTGPTANNRIGDNVTPRTMRDDHGFDSYLLHNLNSNDLDGSPAYTRYWNPKIETASADGSSSVFVSTTSNDYGPDLFVAHLKGFITDAVAAGTPFLAYYPMGLPHDPWQSTPDSTTVLKSGSNTIYFDDNVEYADTLIGQLIAHLDDPDGDGDSSDSVRARTLVIVTADNGTHPDIVTQTDSGPIRGDKAASTHYGTHVPFIINWPGTVAAGVSTRPVDFSDLFPTFLEVAGIEVPVELGLDGAPIIDAGGSVLENRDSAYVWYRAYWGSFFEPIAKEFAQEQRYKLHQRFETNGSVTEAFFDIEADPLESVNLLAGSLNAAQQAAYARLRAKLDAMAAARATTPKFLNGFTRQITDSNLDGNGDSRADTLLAVGDNHTDDQEYRVVAEFDLTHPSIGHLTGAELGSAILAFRVTRLLGSPPDMRIVAMDTDENGDVETGATSGVRVDDFQAAGTTVAVLSASGLTEGGEIEVDVTDFVRADLDAAKSFTAFRLEGIGINPPGSPGADQVRLGGDVGVGAGRESATRLILSVKGDFDANGRVNLADFHRFRTELAAGGPWPGGDLDESGSFDAGDFSPFRDRFGPAETAADYNADGRDDLIDYALQILDSAVAGSLLPAHSLHTEGASDFLQFSFRRFTGGTGNALEGYTAGGVRYAVQSSASLLPGSWNAGPAFHEQVGLPVDNGDGTETVTVRIPESIQDNADGRAFIRLSIDNP